MRVLQLISSGGLYGAEMVLLNLSKSLARMDCQNVLGTFLNVHKVNVEFANTARGEGLHVEQIFCRGRLDWGAVRAIRSLVQTKGIDLVHTHGYKADLYGYAAVRSYPIPLMATCHLWTKETAAVRVYEMMDRAVLPRFDQVVGVSDHISRVLRQLGVAPEKIRTIDNGIDIAPFCAARPTLTGIREQKGKVVGAVGRLDRQKGFEYLLRAAPDVLAEFPSCKFLIVGAGPDFARLQALSRELGIERQVVFTGRRDDMPGVHASLDIFILSSVDEGMPIVVIEALAAGKPVVATSVGAVPKLIIPGETGLLVEPCDPPALGQAILQLLRDPQLARRLGENGQRQVMKNNSADAMAQKYLALYRQLVSNGRRDSLLDRAGTDRKP